MHHDLTINYSYFRYSVDEISSKISDNYLIDPVLFVNVLFLP